MSDADKTPSLDFIRTIVEEDRKNNKHGGEVVTRFPPEPNGYLHIGHAKAICINFGIAADYNGRTHLRFDDTNPAREEVEYIEAIKKDISWLGFDWGEHLYFASDYFNRLYECAIELIKMGKAYVDSLSADEIRDYRGTLTKPGKNSPHRERSVEENLELFEKMKNGECKEGEHVLRSKIDMASPNLNMRDPIIYRVRFVHHHRTGDKWCIYPMYDFTHCLSDAFEGITHSLCSLEFENHRPLYDWYLDQLKTEHHPQQIEFARLNLTYTVMSKRKLLQLVTEQKVSGWDDPRMPTLSGIRRRGYPPEVIREFCKKVGIAKVESVVDIAFLEFCLREYLNKSAPRKMVVLRPLKVVVTNYPEGQEEWLEAENNPEDETSGKRKIPFSRVLYIEQEDFREDPPKKYFRMSPGKEIRLKHAYYVTCTGVIKDENTGEVLEVHCTYDPETRGGWSTDGRKVKGTSHWVSAAHAAEAEIRLYNHLFTKENPDDGEEDKTFVDYINPDSVEILSGCKLEPGLGDAEQGCHYQFLRQGYFCLDNKDSSKERPVFNRIVNMRDTWAKLQRKMAAEKK